MTNWLIKNVRQENYVKVYGSLLVLCRLTAKHGDVAKRMKDKKHNFWFVIEDGDAEETRVVFDNMSNELLDQLRGALTKEMVDNVEIIPAELLGAKLLANATAP